MAFIELVEENELAQGEEEREIEGKGRDGPSPIGVKAPREEGLRKSAEHHHCKEKTRVKEKEKEGHDARVESKDIKAPR